MNNKHYWTGHILSGSQNLFGSFQQSAPQARAPAAPSAPASGAGASGASVSGAGASGAPAGAPDPDGLRASTIWVCALEVTASNFKIDSNDPSSSLSASIDWTNAAAQQAPVTAIYINQEAPAIAAHDATQYNLQWKNVAASDLTGCATVGAVLSLVQGHYS